MIFNSIEFMFFLPIVFLLYWFVFKSIKQQNILLLFASYVFYGCWDWRFLTLIFFSSMVDFLIGKKLSLTNDLRLRKILLITSLVTNLGLLGFFKYYNFFLENFVNAFTFFGSKLSVDRLDIVLPVGISFYTFQTLSYTIDVYKKEIEPTKDFISFFAYVSFFPQLVAGPIERASNLLPQFLKRRYFSYLEASNGLQQMLWGLFKKIVIADNCALYANDIFLNYEEYNGSTIFVGSIFFAFQIYCDFSGYSDIAIGTSRLFGFSLMKNFAFPYFSRDIAEFWRRWHISLSTWFRDYLYIPLGGSKGSKWFQIKNVFIIFIVSGFWHGANWTFIFWGLLNAIYFLPLLLLNKNRVNTNNVAQGKLFPSLKEIVNISITFFITVLAWVFFRAETISKAFFYLERMFSKSLLTIPQKRPSYLFIIILLFILTEWIHREKKYGLELNKKKTPRFIRWIIYYVLIIVIYLFGVFQSDLEFIYFQF